MEGSEAHLQHSNRKGGWTLPAKQRPAPGAVLEAEMARRQTWRSRAPQGVFWCWQKLKGSTFMHNSSFSF